MIQQNALTQPGAVTFVGAGPGSVDMLTMGAFRALQEAEVVIHDRLVGPEILALAKGTLIDAGKEGFGPSTPQSAINALIVGHAGTGARVVRLKGGDCGIFGRLDEEVEALEAAGIAWTVLPGLTSAAAAAAAIGQSLTKRGRNRGLRIVTGHDMDGFADQDWKGLARTGEVAAIYMGKKASRFIQGRLMMHGAAPETPVTLVENATRADQRIIAATLSTLADCATGLTGPAILLYGLAPRAAAAVLPELHEVSA